MSSFADQGRPQPGRESSDSAAGSPECWLTGPELRSRFQQKCEYTRVLQELSTRQQDLIDQEDYSRLIELLLQKQRVIEALQEVSTAAPALQVQWRASRDRLPPELRRDCERWLEEAEELLRITVESEQESTAQMQARREVTQSQLASVSQSLQVHQAYDDDWESPRFDLNS